MRSVATRIVKESDDNEQFLVMRGGRHESD